MLSNAKKGMKYSNLVLNVSKPIAHAQREKRIALYDFHAFLATAAANRAVTAATLFLLLLLLLLLLLYIVCGVLRFTTTIKCNMIVK